MKPFEEHLMASWPPANWQDLGVVVAVSGGADSVALARGLAALKTQGAGRLTVAHFNHRLRGDASNADQRFVQALADQLGLDCVVEAAQLSPAAAKDDGIEAAARHARYEFLRGLAEARGARYVVTAHSLDDQAETVLHHVLRGTGLAGLAGMTRTRQLGPNVTLLRPLLEFRRHELLGYLKSLDQPYCLDATNRDVRFARNWIRHELLPLIERDYRPNVAEALARLATLAGEAQRVVEAAADDLLDKAIVTATADRVVLDWMAVNTHDRHLMRELFVGLWRRQGWPAQDMGFAEWDALAAMAIGGDVPTKRVFPGTVTACKDNGRIELLAPSAR
jgi:tRNA(Ile)-lysidine synthase